ncbi:MAG: nucleotidyltransferase domain-containing protein [Candidatus Woesearchaeota archaeon]
MSVRKRDVLQKFVFEYDIDKFSTRDIALKTGLSKSYVQVYLTSIKNIDTLSFKTKKIAYFMQRIVDCGIIEYLITEVCATCVILFGSVRKGESMHASDIDLCVVGTKKDINVKTFEKQLGHPLDLFIVRSLDALPHELFNNVVNGIVLYGSFKVK